MKKVIRILIYEGPEEWVDGVMEKCYIQPNADFITWDKSITEIYREEVKLKDEERPGR